MHKSGLFFLIFKGCQLELVHGNFTVKLNNNIIFVELDGAFNEHGVLGWVNEIKTIIAQLNGERFAILMDMRKALGGTPESFKVSDQYNSWLNQQNMVAKALIYPSSVYEDMDNTLVPSKKNQNTRVFHDFVEAETWLLEEFNR